jgi:apolipoprotein N-acyltransferase
MRNIVSLVVCALSGLLLALAYPRTGLWPLAWVALVPWLVVVFTARWPVAVAGSWLTGFAFFAVLMSWIAIFGYLPWVLVALIEGSAFVLTAVAVRVMVPPRRSGNTDPDGGATVPGWRILAVASAWVTWEFVRGLGEFGVTWGQVGHSQAPFLPLAQLAAFGGVPAVSFVVLVANAAIADLIVARSRGVGAWRPAAYSAAFVIAGVALGAAHGALVQRAISADHAPALRTGIAQASLKSWLTVEQLNVPLTLDQQRTELAAYADLTREAAARGAKVIIWPESAVPGYLEYEGVIRDAVTSLARELRVWLLVGGPSIVFTAGRAQGLEYNSAYVVSPQGAITGRYDKVHLVPFGEYVPWRKWLPLLSHYQVRETDVTRGTEYRLLRAGGLELGPMICFESVFPGISRREAIRGARALVVITNDAWFLRTGAAAQHVQIGRFRAIEQGLYVARGAATGISCFIDPLGRVMELLPLMKRGVLVADLRPRSADTPYRRVGPLFSFLCVGITALWLIAAAMRRRIRSRPAPLTQ